MNTTNLTTIITDLHAQITTVKAQFTQEALPADDIITLILLDECLQTLERSVHFAPANTNK